MSPTDSAAAAAANAAANAAAAAAAAAAARANDSAEASEAKGEAVIRERRERMRAFSGCIQAPVPSTDALRRSSYYED